MMPLTDEATLDATSMLIIGGAEFACAGCCVVGKTLACRWALTLPLNSQDTGTSRWQLEEMYVGTLA
jgi:hypothetical protein